MTQDDTKMERSPIQLLIAACPATNEPGYRYAWLNGFALLTILPGEHSVELTGEVRIGHRHAENADLVRYLADALDPSAVLAGYDLDDTISRLGRLPIDADRPEPAVALLTKLRAMVDGHPPLDVGCDEDAKEMVHNQSVTHSLRLGGDISYFDEDRIVGPEKIRLDRGNNDSDPLALELTDTACACVLALGECYLPDELGPQLFAAWHRWRRSQVPVFPPVPTLVASQ